MIFSTVAKSKYIIETYKSGSQPKSIYDITNVAKLLATIKSHTSVTIDEISIGVWTIEFGTFHLFLRKYR